MKVVALAIVSETPDRITMSVLIDDSPAELRFRVSRGEIDVTNCDWPTPLFEIYHGREVSALYKLISKAFDSERLQFPITTDADS